MADSRLQASEPSSKRVRLSSGQACALCRRRKQRCDSKRPACSNCDSRGYGAACVYPAPASAPAPAPIPADVCTYHDLAGSEAGPRTAGLSDLDGTAPTAEEPGAARRAMGVQQPGNDTVQSPDEEAFYGGSSAFDFVSKLNDARPLERHLRGHTVRQRGPRGPRSRPDRSVLDLSPGSTVSSRGPECDMSMPSQDMADSLVDAYFDRVHIFYPCLHEPTFRAELDIYRNAVDSAEPVATDHSWLAILYMLFAYGTEFVPTTVKTADGRLLGPLGFVTQARRLVTVAVSRDTTLETVQALLLLSHYLQGTIDFNDCWNVGGLLIRTAISIGLHIDPSDALVPEIEKEVRKRVWAGCFIVDRTLGMKFGRPPAIPIASIKRVELPAVVDDQYITHGTTRARQPQGRPSKMGFFVQTIHQAHIIDQILNDLYLDEPRLQNLERKIDSSQTDILARLLSKATHLDGRLQSWWHSLPRHLREAPKEPDDIDFQRQRCVILLRFLHIRLLVHRQCFLVWSRMQIQDAFIRDVALSSSRCCVLVACQTIQEVKDNFDRQRLGSLWYILYYTFTSVGILLSLTGTQAVSAALIYPSMDVSSLQAWAMAFLERWSSSNVLAARYLFLLRRCEEQLKHKQNESSPENSCHAHPAFFDLCDTFPWMFDTGALDMDAWGLDAHLGNTNHSASGPAL